MIMHDLQPLTHEFSLVEKVEKVEVEKVEVEKVEVGSKADVSSKVDASVCKADADRNINCIKIIHPLQI
jgi:hypothetical protein